MNKQLNRLCTKLKHLQKAAAIPSAYRHRWGMQSLRGRLVEVVGRTDPAQLTAALSLVREVQANREAAAWVTLEQSCFYPPDAAENGIDLDTLSVIRLPSFSDIPKAADKLLRSGGFGLVAMDFCAVDNFLFKEQKYKLSTSQQSRLMGLARKHDSIALIVTGSNKDPLAPLASLRGEARRKLHPKGSLEVLIVKDKRSPSKWTHAEPCRGSAGLR